MSYRGVKEHSKSWRDSIVLGQLPPNPLHHRIRVSRENAPGKKVTVCVHISLPYFRIAFRTRRPAVMSVDAGVTLGLLALPEVNA